MFPKKTKVLEIITGIYIFIKVSSWLLKGARKYVFGKEGMRNGTAFCDGKRK